MTNHSHKKVNRANKTHTMRNIKHHPEMHVPNDQSMHVILVYASWCGHCISLKPHWKNMTKLIKTDDKLKKYCNVVKLDGTKPDINEKIGKYYKGGNVNISGFPTIFISKDNAITKYEGGRTGEELFEWVKNTANNKTVGGTKKRKEAIMNRSHNKTAKRSTRSWSLKFW